MKIAIHHREGSFSDRWIQYCKNKSIDYVVINCYQNDIINLLKVEEITHLMWHFSHELSKDIMVFPYVFNSAEKMGIKTFPNFNTRWHFEDKVAQKYLLESIDSPIVKSYAFYDKEEAYNFIRTIKLPIVAKIKRGAGSINVKLIHTVKEGLDYIEKFFTIGFNPTAKPFKNINQKIRVAKKIRNPLMFFKKLFSYLKKNKRERILSVIEKGYVYFQEFLPNNDFDTRIIVVGNKAFGIRRLNDKNDFRASGSGKIDYSVKMIDIEMVSLAFKTTEKINAQCLAFDFIYDLNMKPKIIEICFAFSMVAYDKCEGYWTRDLFFKEDKFNPQDFMIENLIIQ